VTCPNLLEIGLVLVAMQGIAAQVVNALAVLSPICQVKGVAGWALDRRRRFVTFPSGGGAK
jgi:hypothetical protein